MTTRTALVIGSGIAGPVAGLALQRAGYDPHIYEAHDRPADYVGSFFNFAANGSAALQALGVHEGVFDVGFPTRHQEFRSSTGRTIGRVGSAARGLPNVVLKRSLLHAVVRDATLARGVPISYGKRLVRLEQDPGGVEAHFADGTRVSGDVLLAADGIHSTTRTLVMPHAPRPHYTGLFSIGGFADHAGPPAARDTQFFTFGKRAFSGHAHSPDGETYWFSNVAGDRDPGPVEPSPGAWRQLLSEQHHDDPDPVPALIERTADDQIGAFGIYELPELAMWHAGRVALLGDAAHALSPTSGQGSSLAVEDAVVAARCLRDIGDPVRALEVYQRLRHDRVAKVRRHTRMTSQTKMVTNPVGVLMRDRFMGVGLRFLADPKRTAWLHDHQIDWRERIPTGSPPATM